LWLSRTPVWNPTNSFLPSGGRASQHQHTLAVCSIPGLQVDPNPPTRTRIAAPTGRVSARHRNLDLPFRRQPADSWLATGLGAAFAQDGAANASWKSPSAPRGSKNSTAASRLLVRRATSAGSTRWSGSSPPPYRAPVDAFAATNLDRPTPV